MANVLDKLLINFNKFNDPQFVSGLINEAIRRNENKIILLNTKDQIFNKSITSKGNKIKRKFASYPIYSDGYTKYKKKLGKYRSKIDLSLSGRYLDSYEITYLFQKFLIEPNSENADLGQVLKNAYGDTIEGFTDENLNKISDIIQPDLVKIYLRELK